MPRREENLKIPQSDEEKTLAKIFDEVARENTQGLIDKSLLLEFVEIESQASKIIKKMEVK